MNIICDVCGEKDIEKFKKFLPENKITELVECNSCGFVFIPQYARQNVEYENYRDDDVLSAIRKGNNYVKFRRHKLRIELIKKFKKSGKLYDVGVGWGHFLDTAGKLGFEVEGIEISSVMHHYAVNDLQLPVIKGNFFEAEIKKQNYDVVTLWDVLEHLENHSQILQKIHDMLKDDGILVIQVPQIDSRFAKFQKDKWPMLSIEHINYFSKKTIIQTLEQNGYKVLKMKSSYELKHFLMFVILPKLKRKKIDQPKAKVSISSSERQKFFNKVTKLPKIVLLTGLLVHDFIYNLLSFLNIGEEIIVIAKKR